MNRKFFGRTMMPVLFVLVIGVSAGVLMHDFIDNYTADVTAEDLVLDDQEATIRAINSVMPAVVTIIVYGEEEAWILDLDTGRKETHKEKKKVGAGTGFLISPDGLIITNRHVVNAVTDDSAEYRIILNSGKQYYAQLIGRDPIKDLAILKIFDKDLPYVEFGDSDRLVIGSTVIAIGNALGRYQNSATKGIVSGLSRSIEASDSAGVFEVLDNAIQTDADINSGNSGGPLVDLTGKIVGINTAVDAAGTTFGFAIPINDARPVINSVRSVGRIIRPRLGVRYIMLTPELAQDNKLPRLSGAWIAPGEDGEPAVDPGKPADIGGVIEGDIIFEINAIKIEGQNTLFAVIQKYKPGDRIGLKIRRGDKVIIREVVLDEFR